MDLSPPRLKTMSAWTPWRDDIALSDRALGARMRFLFTPLAAPTLSAAGARAGLGPDGAARERPQADGVDTRPDPRLDRPVASRLPDDISEAAQMAQARAMGVDVPVEAPTLSRAGAMAGLGAFGPSSSSPKAVAAASANDLATSVSRVRMAEQKTTAMQSTPVRAISDGSGRAGISGKGQIAAAGRGFEMRVPKGPVAHDRERWKSGTEDRIAAASKGLSLANMDWGDHQGAPAKPKPKRTWVGKQGDATECPDDCKEACADLAVQPHSPVNKGAPFRELEKERVVSDACPPLSSSLGPLELLLHADSHLLAQSPDQLLMKWQMRTAHPMEKVAATEPSGATRALGPTATRSKASSTPKSTCACPDCSCSSRQQPVDGQRPKSGGRAKLTPSRTLTTGDFRIDPQILSLIRMFALHYGRDTTCEWFAPLFARRGNVVLGCVQRGPGISAWHPNARLGIRRGDKLVGTIHTHSRSSEFSSSDRRAGQSLGVPMVLIAPGAERARLYDPTTRSIDEVPVWGWRTQIGRVSTAPTNANDVVKSDRDDSAGGAESAPRDARVPFAISQPSGTVEVYRAPTAHAFASRSELLTTLSKQPPRPKLIDDDVLVKTVQLAAKYVNASAEAIWWALTIEAAAGKLKVTVAPDPDLFRAIVGVAQRDSPESADQPYTVLDIAKEEPLYVDPVLLDLIIKNVKRGMTPHDVWSSAWSELLAARTPMNTSIPAGLPTPPDLKLFIAIVNSVLANLNEEPREILRQAQRIVGRLNSSIWPRYVAPDLLSWIIIFAPMAPLGAEDQVEEAALQWLEKTGGQFPPEPPADSQLIRFIAQVAHLYKGAAPRDIRNLALAVQLDLAVQPYDCGDEGQPCCADPIDSCNAPAMCDYDGICRSGLWPLSATAYIQNQTFPPLEIDRDWTEEVQGIASRGRFWYVVQGKGWNYAGNNRLWKVPFEIDWDFDWGDYDYAASGIQIARNLYNTPFTMAHWGDPDVHGNRVYVPMEDDDASYDTNIVSEFDADTLAFLGRSLTFTNHAASVAVHPKTGEFYIMNHFYATDDGFQGLKVFEPRGDGQFNLRFNRCIKLETHGVAPPHKIQGVAFSPSGKLYVSASQGVYAFQVSPHRAIFQYLLDVGAGEDEVEGLTVLDHKWGDGSRSQIHVFVLVNIYTAADNAWFKHITVTDGRY